MERERALAAAQTVPIRGDVDANVDEHVRLVRVAAGEGARIVVFPELSLTGYEIDLADALAFTPDDPRLGPIADAASAHAATVVVGAPVRIGSRLHVGALIVTPDRTVDVYTKRRLGAFSERAKVDGAVPPPEATAFSPGELDPLVRVGDGFAAVAVCADVGAPSHARAAAERGAKTYLASMFVIRSELAAEDANLAAIASQHAMTVVFANYGGSSGGLASGGRSGVFSDKGEPLARLDAHGAGVVVAVERADGWDARTVRLPAR